MSRPLYVIGHRNPDTDSICSAIGYAHLKQALGESAVPARAGKINSETRFVLEKFGVEISFPIIEDIKMDVARAYGIVHPGAADTQAVRATFFIDPEGVLRAMVYYPMSNGRSIEEFVRLLQAMQTSDANKVATPEGWTPGCDVIVPPPKTADELAKRAGEGYNTVAWYYSTKPL